MATKKEEKEFEKERKAAIKARYKKMKEEGLEKYLTPEQISYNSCLLYTSDAADE